MRWMTDRLATWFTDSPLEWPVVRQLTELLTGWRAVTRCVQQYHVADELWHPPGRCRQVSLPRASKKNGTSVLRHCSMSPISPTSQPNALLNGRPRCGVSPKNNFQFCPSCSFFRYGPKWILGYVMPFCSNIFTKHFNFTTNGKGVPAHVTFIRNYWNSFDEIWYWISALKVSGLI